MKKRLIGIGVIVLLLTFGCSNISNNADASLPSGFTVVSEDEIDTGLVYKIQDKETKCYYTYSISNYNNANAPVITQMFIKENGVTVPYCVQ